jgi:hypothetical protein
MGRVGERVMVRGGVMGRVGERVRGGWVTEGEGWGR